jgi:hypothetical protein
MPRRAAPHARLTQHSRAAPNWRVDRRHSCGAPARTRARARHSARVAAASFFLRAAHTGRDYNDDDGAEAQKNTKEEVRRVGALVGR